MASCQPNKKDSKGDKTTDYLAKKDYLSYEK